MAQLLLDPPALRDALPGREAAERLRRLRGEGAPPYLCAINIDEVWRGTRSGEEEAVGRLLAALRTARLGHVERERAGRWRARFAASGVTLSQADCLIAAAALGVGARLATGNPRDFPMDELEVEH